METTTARLLDRKVSKGTQSLDLESFWDLYGTKLRVSARRDSYDFQSYARVEVFDPTANKWNHLAHVPYAEMASLAGSVYSPDSRKLQDLLLKDEAELLRLAGLILG